MPSIMNPFTTIASVKRQLIRNVQRRGIDEEDKWAEKAVETLVKKLNKRSLGELLNAVNNPNVWSSCVTIPRTIDGRLQIFHRKMMPHLIYCKVWRWPDLISHHELKPMKNCKFPFDVFKKVVDYDDDVGDVCINPYHYERVEAPRIQDVHVSKEYNYHHHQQQQQQQHENHANKFNTPNNVALQSYTPEPADLDFDEILNYLNEATSSYEPTPATPVDMQQQLQPIQTPNNNTPTNSEAIPYREMPSWATIAYYELNTRVGELFHCTKNIVTVDGYMNPIDDGARLCLGRLSNVNRNSVIDSVRQNIGGGVTLHYFGGDLYAECTSDNSIFVQSRICNCQHNFHLTSVVKVEPTKNIKIFDTTLFANILEKVVHEGFAAVYELVKMCTIRLSFIKGWGAKYYRTDVTETPCWIEITLNGPLKWLDNVLIGMGSPPDAITSVS